MFVTPLVTPALARAGGEERIRLDLRGGGLARNDDGYADHASVFGLSGVGLGGGGMLEAGVRVAPRFWVAGSWAGFGSVARKRTSELSLMTTAVLAHVRVRPFDKTFYARGQRYSFVIDIAVGAGRYRIEDTLDGETRSASSFGVRGGVEMTFYWRAIGYSLGYAHNRASARLEDQLGGSVSAGGHEFTGGPSLRF